MTTTEDPTGAMRTTAQIACEAIINHPDDGYTLADMAAVYRTACQAGVGGLYLGMLADLIEDRHRDASDAGPFAIRDGWLYTPKEGL